MASIPRFILAIVLAACQLTDVAVADVVQPKVSIPGQGVVVGETYRFFREEHPIVDKDIDRFIGIPFAEAPLGDFRFAKPGPKMPWEGEYNATYFRKPCIQVGDEEEQTGDEDCLHLNVWTPNQRVSNASVMVWIHGGAFILGSVVPAAQGVVYDGTALVGFHDIVYVSIQYRLNAFGFMSTGDPELPGNYGLWDQLEALKWIKRNIAAFGGDPNKITIFGESAGSASVGLHLVSPHTWEFYNRAIMQSGTGTSPWAVEYDKAKARRDTEYISNDCGCDISSGAGVMLSCLRALPAANITRAASKVILTTTNIIPLVPVVDGDFLPTTPLKMLETGDFFQGDILLGTNLDEGTLLAISAMPDQMIRKNPVCDRERFERTINDFIYTYRNDLILEAIMQQYVDWDEADDPRANYFFTYCDLMTDEAFACPTDTYARVYAEAGHNVYLYQMTHLPSTPLLGGPPDWLGVGHGEDIPYTFGVAFNPYMNFSQTPEERNMSLDTMTAWTNFAKTGSPNMADPAKDWKAFKLPDLFYKDLSPAFTDNRALKTDQCNFWNHFIPMMVTFAADLSEEEKQWREEFYDWKHDTMPEWRKAFDAYEGLLKNSCISK